MSLLLLLALVAMVVQLAQLAPMALTEPLVVIPSFPVQHMVRLPGSAALQVVWQRRMAAVELVCQLAEHLSRIVTVMEITITKFSISSVLLLLL
jgi:hypothetical protein